MNRLLKAARFAAEKHSEQRRRDSAGTPYINHPIEVAEHLSTVGGVADETILVAALLHDTVEDTDTTGEEIEGRFGKEVLNLVLECTDDKSLPKMERKRLQIVNAQGKSPGAKMIKIADKACNLRSILVDPPKDWPVSRQIAYFTWAARVLAGLRGVNQLLDGYVDGILECGMQKLGNPL